MILQEVLFFNRTVVNIIDRENSNLFVFVSYFMLNVLLESDTFLYPTTPEISFWIAVFVFFVINVTVDSEALDDWTCWGCFFNVKLGRDVLRFVVDDILLRVVFDNVESIIKEGLFLFKFGFLNEEIISLLFDEDGVWRLSLRLGSGVLNRLLLLYAETTDVFRRCFRGLSLEIDSFVIDVVELRYLFAKDWFILRIACGCFILFVIFFKEFD